MYRVMNLSSLPEGVWGLVLLFSGRQRKDGQFDRRFPHLLVLIGDEPYTKELEAKLNAPH